MKSLSAVDNAPNDHVYPQMADFTFYGGLYRNVNVLSVGDAHFELGYYGGPAISVTPEVKGTDAEVEVQVFVTDGDELEYVILDDGKEIAKQTVSADTTSVHFTIPNVHLWNGRKDPHLYTAKVSLKKGGKVVDERTTRFGCRSIWRLTRRRDLS